MTKKFVTRALVITGLAFASASISFAQSPTVAVARRVAVDKINQQPVAASVVAIEQGKSLALTAQQRTALTALGSEATALQAERTRLWSEYNAVIARPDFNDDISTAEAAPRMFRIVEINSKLSAMAPSQESQVASILNVSQRGQLARMLSMGARAQN
jgi:hypothetical protein